MPPTRKSKKVRTTSHHYGTRSASRKPVEIIEDIEAEKKIEDLKLVASLMNWANYEKMMGKIFYDKFGKVLEKQVDAFQKTKAELKACIRENYANQKAMQTPKRAKPATALLEQISKFKALNFDSDDDIDDTTLLEQPEQIVEAEEQTIKQEIEQEHLTERRQSLEPEHHVEQELSMEEERPLEVEKPIVVEQPNVPEPPVEQELSMEEEQPLEAEQPIVEDRLVEEHPIEQHTAIEQELLAENEISFVPETPFAIVNARAPINPPFTPSTPTTPINPKMGTPRGMIGSTVISSMRKLAITNQITKSTQQPIQMPPILRLTPGRNAPEKNTFATPKKTPSRIPLKTPSKTPAALNITFQNERKRKQIDEKADQARKVRDDLLREKADRAKREREERAKRVEQNNKKKEEARLERENNMRRHLEAVKEYQNKEKQAELQNKFNSPIGQARTVQPLSAQNKKTTKTPIMKEVPVTKEKSKEVQQKENCVNKKVTETPIPEFTLQEECTNQTKNTPIRSPVVTIKDVYLNEKENDRNIETEKDVRMPSMIMPDSVDGSELEEISMYDMTKEKIFLPSTENNYNVDDLSSGDDTDNDEQPRKTVPKWALKENILARTREVHRLLTKDQIECHFGKIHQPTLPELFKGYDKDYPPRRASSAFWDSPMSNPTPGVGLFQSKFNNSPSTSKVNIKKR